MIDFVPKKAFFVKGIGRKKDKLASFEDALRNAGIERYNLVYVSSILPPKCKIISKAEASKDLKPGQILFCVMARNETNEPNRLVSAAIGLAIPKDSKTHYGYLSEHHAFGESAKTSGEYAEDLAATMLATTLGVPFDPDQAWDERKQVYKASGHIFTTRHFTQSTKGDKNGLWTTVISTVAFII